MDVSVLGFGGSEIGYERAGARTVARLLGGALDAGLNVIDTAECYEDSEIADRRRAGIPPGRDPPPDQVRPPARLRPRRLARGVPPLEHRAEPQAPAHRPARPDPAPQLRAVRPPQGRGHHRPRARAGARVDALHRLQRRRGGGALRGRVRALRHAPDLGEHRGPGGDRADAAPRGEAGDGRDRQAADRERGVALRAPPVRALLPALLGAAPRAGVPVPARRGARGVHRAALHAGRAGRAHRDRRHQAAGALAGERAPA